MLFMLPPLMLMIVKVLWNNNSSSLSRVINVLADGGYTGENFANEVKAIFDASVEIAKRNELHTFKVIPKRWVVERSFAWLEKCRRRKEKL